MAKHSVELAPDDLHVGRICTQHHGRTFCTESPCENPQHQFAYNLQGVPLKISAISLPYVFVDVGCGKQSAILDVRTVVFCKLDPSYVAAYSGELVEPPPAPAKPHDDDDASGVCISK